MLSSSGLHETIKHLNGEGKPTTITGSSLTRDYIFVSQNLLTHLVGAGQLKRELTFISDHPSIFVQLNSYSLLNTSNTSIMPWPRKLHTMDTASTGIYLEELRRQLFNNDIQNRVKNLFEVPAGLWSEEQTAKYNRLDQHITAIMLSSEKNALRRNRGTMNGAMTLLQQEESLHTGYS